MKSIFFYIISIVFSIHVSGQAHSITISSENIVKIADQHYVDPCTLYKNYYDYLYLIEKNILLKSIKSQVKSLLDYSKKAYDYGEINFMDYQDLKLEFTKFFQQMDQNAYNISIQENHIQLLLKTKSDIYPGNDTLPLFEPYNIIESIEFHATYPHPPDSLVERYLTEEIMISTYFQVHEKLSYYTKNMLPYYKLTALELEKKLELDEISQLEYYLMLIKLTELKLKYFDVLNEYNQTAIKLNYEISN